MTSTFRVEAAYALLRYRHDLLEPATAPLVTASVVERGKVRATRAGLKFLIPLLEWFSGLGLWCDCV